MDTATNHENTTSTTPFATVTDCNNIPEAAAPSNASRLVKITERHENGIVAATGNCWDGLRIGEWSFFSEAGRLIRAGKYLDGKKDGLWKEYFADNCERCKEMVCYKCDQLPQIPA